MSEFCYSTLVCANRDQAVFEQIGYKLDSSIAQTIVGEEISGAIVMIDERASNGHYDELTKLTSIPFFVCNGSCPGAYGDHLIVSDGQEQQYAETLHESNYPAVRVEQNGSVRPFDLREARTYWRIYRSALIAIGNDATTTAAPAGPQEKSDGPRNTE